MELGGTIDVLLSSRGEHVTQGRQWEPSCISLARFVDATVKSNSKFSEDECNKVDFFLRPHTCPRSKAGLC